MRIAAVERSIPGVVCEHSWSIWTYEIAIHDRISSEALKDARVMRRTGGGNARLLAPSDAASFRHPPWIAVAHRFYFGMLHSVRIGPHIELGSVEHRSVGYAFELLDHPAQRDVRQAAFILSVAPANVRVIAGKPQLDKGFDAIDVGPRPLTWLAPRNSGKIGPRLINRHRMAGEADLAIEVRIIILELPSGHAPPELPRRGVLPDEFDACLCKRKRSHGEGDGSDPHHTGPEAPSEKADDEGNCGNCGRQSSSQSQAHHPPHEAPLS